MVNATPDQTGQPTDTSELEALRALEALLGRVLDRRTTGLRSDIDQIRAGQQDLSIMRQALEGLQPIVSRHTNEIGDLHARLDAAANILRGAGGTLLQQAQNLNTGNSVDTAALEQSRQELQRVAEELRAATAGAASRLENIETVLEMDPDTGRSGRLDQTDAYVRNLYTLMGVNATGNATRIDDLEAGQTALATQIGETNNQVGQLNSALLMEDGRPQRITRLEDRVTALENQGGSLGRSLLIGGVVGLVSWLFVAVLFGIPGWADVVIGLTVALTVAGIAMFVSGSNGNSRRSNRRRAPRATQTRVQPQPVPPANGNGQNPGQPANPPAGQA